MKQEAEDILTELLSEMANAIGYLHELSPHGNQEQMKKVYTLFFKYQMKRKD